MKLNHGSLFSGLGGFDLAAEWMGFNNLFHCEVDSFYRKVLKYHFPNAVPYEKIQDADFSIWRGQVDILTGGFPCQPFSTAGHRIGVDDNRYLWPEMLRVIRESKPFAVVGENVTGILSMEESEMFFRVDSRSLARLTNIDHYEAVYTRQSKMLLRRIIDDLEGEGYSVQVFDIPAAGVGAPHRRSRIWIVAINASFATISGDRYRIEGSGRLEVDGKLLATPGRFQVSNDAHAPSPDASYRLCQRCLNDSRPEKNDENPDQPQGKKGNKYEVHRTEQGNSGDVWPVADTDCTRGVQVKREGKESELIDKNDETKPAADTSGSRMERDRAFGVRVPPASAESEVSRCYGAGANWANWPSESPICGGDDGLPTELDGITFSAWRRNSIKGYGNAIVPQIACRIFGAIENYINQKQEK